MNSKNYKEKECNICGKSSINGIMLKKDFICRHCEENIVNLNVNDEKYMQYKEQIKKILFK